MTQLDDFTRRALCATDQPPPGVEDRILAAILGPVGGPGPDGGGGMTSTPAPGSGVLGSSSLVYVAKVVGATIGLAASGVALLAITAAGVRSVSDDTPRRASAPIEVAAAKQLEEPTTVAIVHPETEPPELAEREASPPAIASAPPQKPSKPALVEAQPEDTIEAELELMKGARGSKDHERALALLDRHRREFATGVFAAEREVLRVEHLCGLGRTDEAQTVAASFIQRYPDNPLRSRIEPACEK
jgi:hypothetical protein